MSPTKQVIVLKEDKDLSKGKTISQACHASLGAYREAEEDLREEWMWGGARKIVLDAGDRELESVYHEVIEANLPACLVRDAGLTEVEPGTVTAVGIGPAEEAKIDRITGQLRLVE